MNSVIAQRALLSALIAALPLASRAVAQMPAADADAKSHAIAAAASANSRVADHPATLVYANRPIVELRASVFERQPAERVAAAVHLLDRRVEDAPRAEVTAQRAGDGFLILVAGQPAFGLLPADVDTLKAETLEGKATAAVARLRTAFREAVELRTPSRLLRSGLLALGATAVYVGMLWLLRWTYRARVARWGRKAERQLERLPGAEVIVRASRASAVVRRTSAIITILLGLLLTDMWATFVLRQFPYTRPWGESLRSAALSSLLSAGRVIVDALPGLFTVLIVVLITRILVRAVSLVFDAVADGRIAIPGLYPETVPPTRRIVTALLWLCALVISYRYLPGSDSDVFKGVSVFVGLIVSLGSSGVMNQIMSGLTITYSRALRVGDFVKVGDIEGTVAHIGALATKIKTPRHEEITIPNAVVVSNATTNYTSRADADGVLVPTSVTIGYDVPWRQVHALLLLAAARTAGVQPQPVPVVRQTALQDFYVQYSLLVTLVDPRQRPAVLDALHAHIQDAFNEYGVQIMSPNYEADPSAPKVVPRSQWFAAPATPDGLASRKSGV